MPTARHGPQCSGFERGPPGTGSRQGAATDAQERSTAGDADIDPRLALIKSIVEMMTGRRIEVMSTTDMATGARRPASRMPSRRPISASSTTAPRPARPLEANPFEGGGTIRTADSRDINFSVGLSMSRSEIETSSVSLRAGNAAVSRTRW